jgi:hypothetical protein
MDMPDRGAPHRAGEASFCERSINVRPRRDHAVDRHPAASTMPDVDNEDDASHSSIMIDHQTGGGMRTLRLITVVALLVSIAAFMPVVAGQFAEASSGQTVHHVTEKSETNYSVAIENPTWTFSCSATTGTWYFAIDGVQVIDSAGHPWNDSTGPWTVTFFAADQAGPVPFSQIATLNQNKSNGLFEAAEKGTSTDTSSWCIKGATVSVVGFSTGEEPLLLDGTLN